MLFHVHDLGAPLSLWPPQIAKRSMARRRLWDRLRIIPALIWVCMGVLCIRQRLERRLRWVREELDAQLV